MAAIAKPVNTTVMLSLRHRQMLEAMRTVPVGPDGVRVRDVKETVEDCIERAYFASGKARLADKRRTAKKGER